MELKVYISINYNNLTIRTIPKPAVKGKVFRLNTQHHLRKNAVNRFLREEFEIIELGVYQSLHYEIDLKKVKKLESLLKVNLRTKDIKETLSGYVNGRLSLDETYDQYLPLMIASKLIET